MDTFVLSKTGILESIPSSETVWPRPFGYCSVTTVFIPRMRAASISLFEVVTISLKYFIVGLKEGIKQIETNTNIPEFVLKITDKKSRVLGIDSTDCTRCHLKWAILSGYKKEKS